MNRGVAVLLLILSMASLTIGASLAKSLFELAGPSATTVVRIGIGALVLCLARRPWRHRLSLGEWKVVAAYGVTLGLMNLMFYSAIARLPIGLAIAIEFLGPLGVALWFSKRWLDLAWAGLAAAGVFFVLPLGADSTELATHIRAQSISWSGVAFALGAAITWAIYILIGKHASGRIHAGATTAYGMLIGFLVTVPFGIFHVAPLFSTPTLILTSIGVGLLSSAIPYSLEMVALKYVPEYYFSLLLSLEPAIGAVSAFFLLHEHLTPQQLIAVACIIAASVGSTVSQKRLAPAVTPDGVPPPAI